MVDLGEPISSPSLYFFCVLVELDQEWFCPLYSIEVNLIFSCFEEFKNRDSVYFHKHCPRHIKGV
jgi:hypothetical protein